MTSSNSNLTRCRLCGRKEYFAKLINIFERDRELQRKIVKLLPVVVDPSDPLPHEICRICVHKLKSFSDFYEKAIKTDRFLRGFMQSVPAAEIPDPFIQMTDCVRWFRNYLKLPPEKSEETQKCCHCSSDIEEIVITSDEEPPKNEDTASKSDSPSSPPSLSPPQRTRSLDSFLVHEISKKDVIYTCRKCVRTFTKESSALTHLCEKSSDSEKEEVDNEGEIEKAVEEDEREEVDKEDEREEVDDEDEREEIDDEDEREKVDDEDEREEADEEDEREGADEEYEEEDEKEEEEEEKEGEKKSPEQNIPPLKIRLFYVNFICFFCGTEFTSRADVVDHTKIHFSKNERKRKKNAKKKKKKIEEFARRKRKEESDFEESQMEVTGLENSEQKETELKSDEEESSDLKESPMEVAGLESSESKEADLRSDEEESSDLKDSPMEVTDTESNDKNEADLMNNQNGTSDSKDSQMEVVDLKSNENEAEDLEGTEEEEEADSKSSPMEVMDSTSCDNNVADLKNGVMNAAVLKSSRKEKAVAKIDQNKSGNSENSENGMTDLNVAVSKGSNIEVNGASKEVANLKRSQRKVMDVKNTGKEVMDFRSSQKEADVKSTQTEQAISEKNDCAVSSTSGISVEPTISDKTEPYENSRIYDFVYSGDEEPPKQRKFFKTRSSVRDGGPPERTEPERKSMFIYSCPFCAKAFKKKKWCIRHQAKHFNKDIEPNTAGNNRKENGYKKTRERRTRRLDSKEMSGELPMSILFSE